MSSDDRTHLRRCAAGLVDGLACELHRALHQRPVTLRVGLGGHVMNVRPPSSRPSLSSLLERLGERSPQAQTLAADQATLGTDSRGMSWVA